MPILSYGLYGNRGIQGTQLTLRHKDKARLSHLLTSCLPNIHVLFKMVIQYTTIGSLSVGLHMMMTSYSDLDHTIAQPLCDMSLIQQAVVILRTIEIAAMS